MLARGALGSVTDTIGYNSFAEPLTYSATYNGAPLYSVQRARDPLGRITVFTDTLLATARDRSVYRVRSVDFAGNYSAPGAPVGVTLPDRLPPVVPTFLGNEVAGGRVHLRFASPSADVAAYEIRRTPQGAASADVTERSTTGEWTDRGAKHGIEYRYQIVAIDSAGNRSVPSRPLVVKPYWKEEIPAPPGPALAVSAGPKTAVSVSWHVPEGGQYSAIVFRRKGEGAFLQLSPLLPGTVAELPIDLLAVAVSPAASSTVS